MGFALLLGWAFTVVCALVFGSFLNVCIARLPRHRSIASPGSHCPRCQAPIRALDNIPIVSWLLLRGRCRACHEPISPRYPLVEAAYTLLVVAVVLRWGLTLPALGAAIFCFFVLALGVTDLETMLLPDALTLPGLALALLFTFLAPGLLPATPTSLSTGLAAPLSLLPATHQDLGARLAATLTAALAAGAWALVLLTIRLAYYLARRRHGLGLGDVKLAAMLAAWLGAANTAVVFFLAVIAAALTGGLLLPLVLRRTKAPPSASWRTTRLPLGTFLCAGALYALFFGPQTLKWYLSFYQ